MICCKHKHKNTLQREETGAATEQNPDSPHLLEGKSEKKGVKKEGTSPAVCVSVKAEDGTPAEEKNLRERSLPGRKKEKKTQARLDEMEEG